MPEKIKRVENLVGHLTKAQVAARKKAEDGLKSRGNPLEKPRGFKKDKGANYYWDRTIRHLKDIDLLDVTDSDTLASYCRIMARIDFLEEAKKDIIDSIDSDEWNFQSIDPILKQISTCEKTQLQYATKLGLTPESRGRLAKEKAKPKEVDPIDDLYGHVEVIDCASGN